jgi:hypothetical protein
MNWDELLLCTVLVMLIASTYTGFCVQRSLYHSKKTFEALIQEIGGLRLATLDLDQEVAQLKHRVTELEK